ncbi:hypothetical protein EMIT047CA2_30101 [Pseudomonas soli]
MARILGQIPFTGGASWPRSAHAQEWGSYLSNIAEEWKSHQRRMFIRDFPKLLTNFSPNSATV